MSRAETLRRREKEEQCSLRGSAPLREIFPLPCLAAKLYPSVLYHPIVLVPQAELAHQLRGVGKVERSASCVHIDYGIT